MKILAHIHTLNDDEVINISLRAVLEQTLPVNGVLIVDNKSSDGTLDRNFPKNVTVIRNDENLGTSGAVHIGLRYGLEHGYDWVWTLDGDSAPQPDALAKLQSLYAEFSQDWQDRTAWIACLPINVHDRKPRHGLIITPGSYVEGRPSKDTPWYRCDVSVWSGTLFRLDAIKKIGLPSMDYVLDWGEFEFGYRVQNAGYYGFVHTESVVDHDIGGTPSSALTRRRLGPLTVTVLEVPPIRAYYYIRNNLYFWLHEYRGPNRFAAVLLRLYKCSKLIVNALFVQQNRCKMLDACGRAYWDGIFGNIRNRYRSPGN